MIRNTLERRRGTEPRDRIEIVEDARHAALAASWIAHESVGWSRRYAIAEDDAAEAVRAAIRARIAAEHAEHAGSEDEAMLASRAAWAAVMSAHEADGRVVSSIADAMSTPGP